VDAYWQKKALRSGGLEGWESRGRKVLGRGGRAKNLEVWNPCLLRYEGDIYTDLAIY
jgi:hypothetical protein